MKSTNDIFTSLKKYGNVKRIESHSLKETTIFLLEYEAINSERLSKLKGFPDVPVLVTVKDKEDINFRVYLFGENVENKEKIMNTINIFNSKFEYVKFYMDEAKDICCEMTVDLNCEDDIGMRLDDLVTGYVFVAASVIKDKNEKKE